MATAALSFAMTTFISTILWGVLQCVAVVLSFIYLLAILNLFLCEMDVSIPNPVFLGFVCLFLHAFCDWVLP